MSVLLTLWKKLPIPKPVRLFLLRRLNDNFIIGVTGVIFNEKNQVLLVKHTYRRVAWSLPGGYLQAHEHPKKGLAREILEETGFTVKIIRIITTKTDKKGRLDISYFGKYIDGRFKKSPEVSHYKFVNPGDLPDLLEDQYDQIAEGLQRKKRHDWQHRWNAVTDFVRHPISFFRERE